MYFFSLSHVHAIQMDICVVCATPYIKIVGRKKEKKLERKGLDLCNSSSKHKFVFQFKFLLSLFSVAAAGAENTIIK
jgi:hypothetical protein